MSTGRPEDLPGAEGREERISFLPIPSSNTSFSALGISSFSAAASPATNKSGLSVEVTATSWSRDSHDLFDFEAQTQKVTQQFSVVGRSATFVRQGTEVQMVTDHAPAKPGWDALIRLVRRDGVFWVDRTSGSSKRLWLVVHDLPTKAHTLSEGDLIKLGRFKLRVRQMVTDEQSSVVPDLRLEIPETAGGRCCAVVAPNEGQLSGSCCRICLLEAEQPTEDPLISPCKCKGTVEYVHLGCLRHWIRLRLKLNESASGSYFYKPVVCELCKTSFPDYVEWRGERKPLTEVPYTQPPYVVLQNTGQDAQQPGHRGLHVVSLAENKLLKLGRGHESDVRIADVSISRWHATIRLQDGEFLVEDRDSKFGTLVALKKPRAVDADGRRVSIQMGRTVLTMSARNGKEGLAASAALQLPGSVTAAP